MRVLLISANTEPINMPVLPMGLGCVAVATRRAGHEVKMLDLMGVEKAALLVKEAVEGFEPEVIGISVRNIDDQRMENPRFLVDQAREVVFHCRDSSKAHIVLGGSGYSIFPQSVLAYLGADMGIQGEGERAFPILLSRIESGAKLLGVQVSLSPGSVSWAKRHSIRTWTSSLSRIQAFGLHRLGRVRMCGCPYRPDGGAR
jgi:hypothetical protein